METVHELNTNVCKCIPKSIFFSHTEVRQVFLFLIQNICGGYSKRFCEHPKHMLKLKDKKIITILCFFA